MSKKNDESKPELAFFTNDELLTELATRTELGLFLSVDHKGTVNMYRRGYSVACIGLADYARKRLYELLMDGD